ncbi:hypothetical protein UCDDS831_g03612 [Diplodia seriata]|uniref:Ubiquitin 3 binding protein But2 C-terminal domain-containing protein n=1 Tax=Diplodia seriata TaxID=420778 RepID=A0A0G2EHY5_9PEZI|nr:hypothetical protein UCDDS831_g03612 [Diplodia seriata]
MLFTTLTTAVLSGAALAATLPRAANPPTGTLERRGCQTLYPTHLFQIMQDEPEHNTGDHDYVYTAQGEHKTSQWVTELQFANIPADAAQHGSCNVEFFFKAGYHGGGPNSPPGVETTGGTPENPTRLDFFSVDRDVDVTRDSWLDHPGKVSNVGTQIVAASATQDTRLTPVTGACKETLNYLIEVEGDRAGSVAWFQSDMYGLRLTYGC